MDPNTGCEEQSRAYTAEAFTDGGILAVTAQHQQPTPERFFNAINAYGQTEAMKAAIELEIFTAIAEGNTTAATIAKRCEAAERGVRPLCDFLTIHGFLRKEGAQYALAPDSAYSSTGIHRHILAPPLNFC